MKLGVLTKGSGSWDIGRQSKITLPPTECLLSSSSTTNTTKVHFGRRIRHLSIQFPATQGAGLMHRPSERFLVTEDMTVTDSHKRQRYQRRNAFCFSSLLQSAVLAAIQSNAELSEDDTSVMMRTHDRPSADTTTGTTPKRPRRQEERKEASDSPNAVFDLCLADAERCAKARRIQHLKCKNHDSGHCVEEPTRSDGLST